MVLNPVHLLGGFFSVDLDGSLPLRPISIMDLGYCVQMNPITPFYGLWKPPKGPKQASKWTIFTVLNPVLLLGGFSGLTMVDGW